MSDDPNDALARQQGIVLSAIKGCAAVFMLLAVVMFFNLGGAADLLGMNDGVINRVFGGALFAIGIFEFLFLPNILRKAWDKNKSDGR